MKLAMLEHEVSYSCTSPHYMNKGMQCCKKASTYSCGWGRAVQQTGVHKR